MAQGYHSNLGIDTEFGQNPIKQKNLHFTFPLLILLATENQDMLALLNLVLHTTSKGDLRTKWIVSRAFSSGQ